MTALPPTVFDPPPGIVKDDTTYAQGHRWVDGDKMRFHDGRPQPIGGWEAQTASTVIGKARGSHEWRLVAGNPYAALGTHKKLYALVGGGTLTDITPLRRSVAGISNRLSTTDTDETVNVEDSGHGAATGDYVEIEANGGGSIAIGGVTIEGDYEVTKIDDDNYTIEASSAATSTVTSGGGSIDIDYQIAIGREFGVNDPTQGRLDARSWDLDNWGDLLIACHNDNSSIWEWDPSVGGRATVVANAPTNCRGMFITKEFHVVALGADGDPLNVRHSHQNDRTLWTAAITNQAGERRLQGGNRIVGGHSFRSGVNLIWTDTVTFAMVYTPTAATWFGYPAITLTAGMIAPNAFAMSDDTIYWMGRQGFYRYDGVFRQLTPNEIDDSVFNNIAADQESLSHAWFNRRWREVWFHYCTGTDIDRYVLVDPHGHWSVGRMDRTTFTDQGVFDYPLGVDTAGTIFKHEFGKDAAGAALSPYWESGFGEVRQGYQAVDVSAMIPDFKDQVGAVLVTFKTKDAPNDQVVHQDGPYYSFPDTKELDDMRVNGNLLALRFEQNSIGAFCQAGKHRLIAKPAGGR